MLKNMIVITIRNIKHQKVNFLITLTGLATGLAVAFFCYLFVIHELQYDQYHLKKDSIYRMLTKKKDGGYRSSTPFVLKEAIENEFPEIEAVAQISENWQPCIMKKDNLLFKEKSEIYTDSKIFNILSIPLLYGNPSACLSNPTSVVISEKIADKYFPTQNPINQLLSIKVGEQFKSFTVTGVLRSISQGSFFKPDIILPKEVQISIISMDMLKGWNGSNPQTFMLFNKNASTEEFKSKLKSFSERCIKKGYDGTFEIQSLKRMHLFSEDIGGVGVEGGSVTNVLVFTSIGLLILLLGCINFVNLSMAQSMKRTTEIGVRKVLGAGLNHIRIQFLTESLIIAITALPIAIGLLVLFLPFGSRLINRNLEFNLMNDYLFTGGVILLTIIVGFISGSYNAFYVSRLKVVEVFKSKVNIHSSKSGLHRILLSVQFIIFNALIICSLSMFQQMYFIQHKQLGFNKEQLLSLYLPTGFKDTRIATFKNEVANITSVKHVSISSFVPPGIGNWMGTNIPDPKDVNKTIDINYIISDLDYFSTIEFNIKYGRYYSPKTDDVPNKRLVLNDAAAHLLNIESPIGHKINLWGGRWEIIGVIKDFHTHSLYNKIPPLFFFSTDKIDNFSAQFLNNYAIRIQAGTIPETLYKIEQVWKKLFPNEYFDYRFADEEFDKLHRNDQHLSQLLLIFTITAVVLSCMGLFGLISFTSQNRTKEIGIRKTFGASIIQIFGLLTREFSIIFIISIFVSIPVSAYFMNRWLHNFAYQANVGPDTFAVAVFLAYSVTILTVSWQAIRTAVANPVESLRYE
jgi:putative ABC transport system permease protein